MLTSLFPGVLLAGAYTALSLLRLARDSYASKTGAITGLISFGICLLWLFSQESPASP